LIGADRASDRRSEQNAIIAVAVAKVRSPADPNPCINLLPKCKLYLGVNLAHSLISFKIPFKVHFLCRLGLRVGFLYRLGFWSRVSSAHFCIF